MNLYCSLNPTEEELEILTKIMHISIGLTKNFETLKVLFHDYLLDELSQQKTNPFPEVDTIDLKK